MKIAADTSTIVAFFQGDFCASDVKLLQEAIEKELLVLPPIVLSEILSVPKLPKEIAHTIKKITLLECAPDFWIRVGQSRSILLRKKLKCRMADAIIAQCCIDSDTALITRDKDFRHFARHCNLHLL